MGFPKIAPPSGWALVVYSGSDCLGLRLGFPRFSSPLPKDESCSVFVVSHHLGGLLRRESRGFVAPRSRSWGSSCCGFDVGVGEPAPKTPPSATSHPSKSLHARSCPTCLHVLLDACPLPVDHPKTARVQGVSPRGGFTVTRRLCSRVLRTTSLGFFFTRSPDDLDRRLKPAPQKDADRTRFAIPPANRSGWNQELLPVRNISRRPRSHPLLNRKLLFKEAFCRFCDQVRPGCSFNAE
jgi:hypothetical protein